MAWDYVRQHRGVTQYSMILHGSGHLLHHQWELQRSRGRSDGLRPSPPVSDTCSSYLTLATTSYLEFLVLRILMTQS